MAEFILNKKEIVKYRDALSAINVLVPVEETDEELEEGSEEK